MQGQLAAAHRRGQGARTGLGTSIEARPAKPDGPFGEDCEQNLINLCAIGVGWFTEYAKTIPSLDRTDARFELRVNNHGKSNRAKL